jgi:hypothetical protein
MFTLTLLIALIINIPQGEIVPAKRFDWNEFHYVDSKPKPKFIRPVYIPGAARVRRPVYVKPVTVITSDNLTVDCLPKYR